MTKFKPTPEMLTAIITRVPEGFIHKNVLRREVRVYGRKNAPAFKVAIDRGDLARTGPYFYDPSRLTAEQVEAMVGWCDPALPELADDGLPKERPILERRAERDQQLHQSDATAYVALVRRIEDSPGYLPKDALLTEPDDVSRLQDLLNVGVLSEINDLIYDPLYLSQRSMREVIRQRELQDLIDAVQNYLQARPGATAPRDELSQKFGQQAINEVMQAGCVTLFKVESKRPSYQSEWLFPVGGDRDAAQIAAEEAVKIHDTEWQPALEACGADLKPGAVAGETCRDQVIARSYTVGQAAKRLKLSSKSIEKAIQDQLIDHFTDPEGRRRLPAHAVESALSDEAQGERIAGYEVVPLRDLATVEGVSYSTIKRRLRRLGVKGTRPRWEDLRGQWSLPETYPGYQQKLLRVVEAVRAQREAELAEQQRILQEKRENERREREALRQRLVNAFPTWQHEGRLDQHISLHIGPPNSGKTHDSLNALSAAESGWYLAPLRLLAFEIFDRLNQRGVPCNLLTGEESIDVEGATITAATIEMFNPAESGECIIIDEAQMLADTDRGWAWTRALMEAQAPEIHVIGPDTARDLIVQMAKEAAIPYTVIAHQRLAPIKVAARPWSLEQLPARTILVAFSRRMVLHLKTELEQLKRTVSVVYGSLPPEVRRKQADRFATGDTEICVATDAVGMGLNLPADNVCFYEVEKFDGTSVRTLNPSEVQQIGGRAGRYGFSRAGEVGAVNKRDLKTIEALFYAQPKTLTHARVAPTVQDLELIPGSLYARLERWAELESIPDTLRHAIKTTDLDERIELAKMLTDEDVAQLGLSAAVRLINAPTRQSSRAYWFSCAQAVIKGRMMPLPPKAPAHIRNSRDLETTESAISCADIYLWLCSRREFHMFGDDEMAVREERRHWSGQIDDALLRKIDTARRCSSCGKRLPRGHRFGICDRCFHMQRRR